MYSVSVWFICLRDDVRRAASKLYSIHQQYITPNPVKYILYYYIYFSHKYLVKKQKLKIKNKPKDTTKYILFHKNDNKKKKF